MLGKTDRENFQSVAYAQVILPAAIPSFSRCVEKIMEHKDSRSR